MGQLSKHTPPGGRDTLMVELGSWFRATATGAGIFAVPVLILLLVAGAIVIRAWL